MKNSVFLLALLFLFGVVSVTLVKGDDGGVDCYACSSASPDICNDDHENNITIPGYIPNLTAKSGFNVEALGNNSYLTCKDFFKVFFSFHFTLLSIFNLFSF